MLQHSFELGTSELLGLNSTSGLKGQSCVSWFKSAICNYMQVLSPNTLTGFSSLYSRTGRSQLCNSINTTKGHIFHLDNVHGAFCLTKIGQGHTVGGVDQKRTQYYEFISNSDVILRTRGGGGKKRAKICVRTKCMLPNDN